MGGEGCSGSDVGSVAIPEASLAELEEWQGRLGGLGSYIPLPQLVLGFSVPLWERILFCKQDQQQTQGLQDSLPSGTR